MRMKTRPCVPKNLKGVLRIDVRENFKRRDALIIYWVHTENTLNKEGRRKKHVYELRGVEESSINRIPCTLLVVYETSGVVQKVTYSKIMQHELKRLRYPTYMKCTVRIFIREE